MGITGAFILFILFIAIYVLIAEVFTVLFRLTGLTEEKARFQVISLLTNSGFTTGESEMITTSKKRRTLARLTMLFGYSFTATIVSVLVNLFLSLSVWQIENLWLVVGAAVVICVLFFFLKRVSRLRTMLDHYISILGNKWMFGSFSNPIMVLDRYADRVIAEIHVTNLPLALKETTLAQAGLQNQYKIQLLLIEREKKAVEINGETMVLAGDVLVVFGPHKEIRHLFENPTESKT